MGIQTQKEPYWKKKPHRDPRLVFPRKYAAQKKTASGEKSKAVGSKESLPAKGVFV